MRARYILPSFIRILFENKFISIAVRKETHTVAVRVEPIILAGNSTTKSISAVAAAWVSPFK